MTKDKALKLALEALEEPKEHFAKHRRLEAITAIKEALAQPEQEPVAWMDEDGDVLSASIVDGKGLRNIPLYTNPPQPKEPEQEPVAYINIEQRKLEWAYKYMSWDTPTVVNLPKIPLYTTPLQRTWVGLTHEEIEEVERWVEFKEEGSGRIPMGKLVAYISEKLKSKNNG